MEEPNQENPSSHDFSLLIKEINAEIDKVSILDTKVEEIETCYSLKPWSFNGNLESLKSDIQIKLESLGLFKNRSDEINNIVKFNDEASLIYSKYMLSYSNLCHKIEKFFLQVNFDMTHCYGLPSNKECTLFVYNLEEGKKEKVVIEELKSLDSSSCLIQLQNNELFCYENKGSPYYGTNCSWIIDLNTFAIKKAFPSWNLSIGAGGIYLENKVILFGGYRRRDFLKECSQFDLIKQKWTQLPPILVDSYQISCVVFKDIILLCGFVHARVYIYDLRIESCSEISSINLNPLKLKSLMTANSRAYVFEYKGGIFETETEDEYNWSFIGNIPNENLIPFKMYDQTLIFAESTKTEKVSFYKFDLIEKKLRKISY
ncbi:unnamed protein product [Blepharisma stoltei]|uniref:Kelch motif family protein n=1 Tax=Blepharisma stoltei TaxID=1481888 RepID=A0AAU9JMW3_9CILI|nr:unnamed protein product [Blepharisma stoltei]